MVPFDLPDETSDKIPQPSLVKMVVGLGNPGREYENTRHNIGFMAIDEIVQRHSLPALTFTSAWQAGWTKDSSGCFYVKPTTFMNRSGFAVHSIAKFYKISVQSILIIFDDLNLPLGRLRLRASGSAGGQNGMKSILEHLGTEQIPRLRIGIGAVKKNDVSNLPQPTLVNHVLGRFRSEEKQLVKAALQRAGDAVDCAREKGLSAAMNEYNRSIEQKP